MLIPVPIPRAVLLYLSGIVTTNAAVSAGRRNLKPICHTPLPDKAPVKVLLKESIKRPTIINSEPDKNTFLAPNPLIDIPAGTAHRMPSMPAKPEKSPSCVPVIAIVFLIAGINGTYAMDGIVARQLTIISIEAILTHDPNFSSLSIIFIVFSRKIAINLINNRCK